MEIIDENGGSFGQYCGNKNGQSVVVNGRLVVLRFRRGYYSSSGQFRLLFIPVDGKYRTKIELKSQQCKIRNLLAATEP